MKKLLTALLFLLTGTTLFAAENIFQVQNHTPSDLDIRLRLGSKTEKIELSKAISDTQPSEKEIRKDTRTCLNGIKVLATSGKLVGKESNVSDIKGCSGKRIIIFEENGALVIKGIKESFAPELGKKKPNSGTTTTGTTDTSTTTGTDTTSSSDITTTEDPEDIKKYS